MVVVIANNLPDAVRGRMKLWFVEVRPNIFLSGIKEHVAINVINYLVEYCPFDSGLLVFRSINVAPGYEIKYLGIPKKPLVEISSLQLIINTPATL